MLSFGSVRANTLYGRKRTCTCEIKTLRNKNTEVFIPLQRLGTIALNQNAVRFDALMNVIPIPQSVSVRFGRICRFILFSVDWSGSSYKSVNNGISYIIHFIIFIFQSTKFLGDSMQDRLT